jgi:hypothetical protein
MSVQEGEFGNAGALLKFCNSTELKRGPARGSGGRPTHRKKALTPAEKQSRYRKSKTARAKREAARRAREEADRLLAEQTGGSYTVHHLAIEDATPDHLADASVEAIITDPPYPPQFLPTFSYLAGFAERTLKRGGWCIVMTGIVYLPEVANRLAAKLQYRWQYVVTTQAAQTSA